MAVPSVVAMAATRAGRRTSLTSGLDRGVVHVPWRSANEASHVHVKDINNQCKKLNHIDSLLNRLYFKRIVNT